MNASVKDTRSPECMDNIRMAKKWFFCSEIWAFLVLRFNLDLGAQDSGIGTQA